MRDNHPHINDLGLCVKRDGFFVSMNELMDRLEKIDYPLCTDEDITFEFGCGRNIRAEITNYFHFHYSKHRELLDRFYNNHGEAKPSAVIEYYLKGVKTGRIEEWINYKKTTKGRTTLVSFIKNDKPAFMKYLEHNKNNPLCTTKNSYAVSKLESLTDEFNLNDLDESKCSKELFLKYALLSDKYDVVIRPKPKN
jgi:hypothetical protein